MFWKGRKHSAVSDFSIVLYSITNGASSSQLVCGVFCFPSFSPGTLSLISMWDFQFMQDHAGMYHQMPEVLKTTLCYSGDLGQLHSRTFVRLPHAY